MKKTKLVLAGVTLATALVLSACGDAENIDPDEQMNQDSEESAETDHSDMDDHAHMDHSSSGEVPDGLEEAENSTFEVGSQAMITDGHMPGMEGAEATIVGAYNTIVYAVSYEPTDGGPREEGHKWVIHEELEEATEEPYEVGDEVTLDTDHMEGMQGATAVIDTAEETTVYMVDFTLTDSGEAVENHKWVTEEEFRDR